MKDKIILFDLDGTLIDSTQAVYEGICKACEALNHPVPSYEKVSLQIGHTLEDMFKTFDVESSKIPDFIAIYRQHYGEICIPKTHLLNNAQQAIIEAHSFAHLGVVTTKTGKYSKIILEHLKVLEYFTCVIGREDVKEAKPSAEPILLALKSMPKDITKDHIYMIGDTPLDIQAANNANIQSIGVLSGYASLELLQSYTNRIVKDSLEAVRKIQTL